MTNHKPHSCPHFREEVYPQVFYYGLTYVAYNITYANITLHICRPLSHLYGLLVAYFPVKEIFVKFVNITTFFCLFCSLFVPPLLILFTLVLFTFHMEIYFKRSFKQHNKKLSKSCKHLGALTFCKTKAVYSNHLLKK